jgi:flagellar basal body L-ring protein FlgH
MFRVVSQHSVYRILLFLALGLMAGGAIAQDQPKDQAQDPQATDKSSMEKAAAKQAQPPDAVDPLKRPADEKQRKKNARALKQELSKPYKKWLDEDVAYIITDEERAAFKQLSNDEERDNFIEAFWQRRNPTPDTEENEFKEEHYQRIAYANDNKHPIWDRFG